jgi:chromate transporter
MMKDFYLVSWRDIAINLAAIGATWAVLSLTKLPSPVIVLAWLLAGWLVLVL